jgi:glycosyltransferase involved in cell wall biosynthesis
MPSFNETFGIVYLEAMSQGLPILYSQNQGIDGYFNYRIPGYSVDPNNLNDIKNKILKAFKNHKKLRINALYHVDKFSWKKITLSYNKLYSDIIKN